MKNKKIIVGIVVFLVVFMGVVIAEGTIKTKDGDIILDPASGKVISTGEMQINMPSNGCNAGLINLWDTTDNRGWHITNRQEGCGGVNDALNMWFHDNGRWSLPFVINPDGKVGIGTAKPVAKLEVQGGDIYVYDPGNHAQVLAGENGENFVHLRHDSNTHVGFVQNWANNKVGKLALNPSGGNVGVGTSDPTSDLMVRGKPNQLTTIELLPRATSGGWSSRILFGGSANGREFPGIAQIKGSYYGGGPQAGFLYFLTNDMAGKAQNRMTVDFKGDVGIGTTTPTKKLEVIGEVKANALCIGDDCRTSWPEGGAAITSTPAVQCTTRVTTVNPFVWSSGAMAKCNDDEIMTGGGCQINDRSGGSWIGNAPDRNGYYCLPAQSKEGALIRALARCCKFN